MTAETDGQNSRRTLLRAGIAAIAAIGAGVATQAQAQQKLPKAAVQYQDTPKGTQKCSDCVNFVAPNACKIVSGDIAPNGWCVAFAPKAS